MFEELLLESSRKLSRSFTFLGSFSGRLGIHKDISPITRYWLRFTVPFRKYILFEPLIFFFDIFELVFQLDVLFNLITQRFLDFSNSILPVFTRSLRVISLLEGKVLFVPNGREIILQRRYFLFQSSNLGFLLLRNMVFFIEQGLHFFDFLL